MRCPVCGYKIKNGNICPYCKIDDDQIKNASNKQAIQHIKEHKKDVVLSDVLPSDINYTRLLLMTILLGVWGGHNFYVGRYKRGLFFVFAFFIAFIAYTVYTTWYEGNKVIEAIMQVFIIFEAVAMCLWLSDVFRVIAKKFPVPVVLAEKQTMDTLNKTKKKWNNNNILTKKWLVLAIFILSKLLVVLN